MHQEEDDMAKATETPRVRKVEKEEEFLCLGLHIKGAKVVTASRNAKDWRTQI